MQRLNSICSRGLAEAKETRFQWWMAGDTDIYCRVRPLENVTEIECGLEGKTAEELARVRRAMTAFIERSPLEVRGLVIDEEGVTEGYAWSKFLSARKFSTTD